MIIFGLKFSSVRVRAQSGGYLMPGRKSKVKRETLLLTTEQANWRLANWKTMIQNYRHMGYSYPTISRIKKAIMSIVSSKGKYTSLNRRVDHTTCSSRDYKSEYWYLFTI